jgi:hypothetical protein
VHQLDVILRSFDAPDEFRNMEYGRFEVVRFRGQIYGRATYEPGWQWSKHVGPTRGARWCVVEHVGFVVGGAAVAAFEDGSTIDLLTGQLSIYRLSRTIAGSSVRCRMSRCICSAQMNTRRSRTAADRCHVLLIERALRAGMRVASVMI